MITDKQIRAYRDSLPLGAYDYDEQLTIRIALGKREPYDGMSKAQARKWVEQRAALRVLQGGKR